MRIAVCDDDKRERVQLLNFINDYCTSRILELTTVSFDSGEIFLSTFTPGMFDIIFLDIYMPGINGIETAEKIRRIDKNVLLIFCTSSTKFYAEGFAVAALHYIIKPVHKHEVIEALDRCTKVLGDTYRKITIRTSHGHRHIRIIDIVFIEVIGHYCNIHLPTEVVTTKQSLRVLMDTINSDIFFCCHRSYYVNLRFVKTMKEDTLQMKTEEIVPVSRKKRQEVSMTLDRLSIDKI